MRRIVALVCCLSAAPALAQDDGFDEGFDLLDRGARMLFQELFEQMDPALQELRGVLEDLNAYHPPEVLPNGDIIIRRKEPLVPGEIPKDGIEL